MRFEFDKPHLYEKPNWAKDLLDRNPDPQHAVDLDQNSYNWDNQSGQWLDQTCVYHVTMRSS